METRQNTLAQSNLALETRLFWCMAQEIRARGSQRADSLRSDLVWLAEGTCSPPLRQRIGTVVRERDAARHAGGAI